VTEYVFQTSNIVGKKFFEILTDFSRFSIRKTYGANFYDFKIPKSRMREFIFTIDINKFTEEKSERDATEKVFSKENMNEYIFELLNRTKTLIGRISSVLIHLEGEDKDPTPCVLLEVKLSKKRENFDDFVWKEISS
jgi:hypothetical protein